MRKIINGKKYDTDTATEVGNWDNGAGLRDFRYCEETLYRKRTGEYFIYGYGHAMSRYAERCGDMWGAGSAIIPLTYDAARQWAEEHLDAEEYEKEFGEVSEGESDGTVAMTFRVGEAAKVLLQRESSRTGRSQSEIVDSLLMGLSDDQ